MNTSRFSTLTTSPTFSDSLADEANNAPPSSGLRPIVAILTSTGSDRLEPNSHFDLGVTVTNQGGQDAIIDVLIDEHQPILRDWCSILQKRLALGPNQSGEVLFSFDIPADTPPSTYSYDLIIDAREAYPNTPALRYNNRQFQVLLPDNNPLTQTSDPALLLDPRTTSHTPLPLRIGEPVTLRVALQNRSDRVDRYRLLCTGLPPGWTTRLIYPTAMTGLGLVTEADSIGLNPGDSGQVQVQITAPPNALAGPYSPTLRLTSENQPDLGLMDLVYLEVQPTYFLSPQLQALASQAGDRPAQFELQLANAGNTERQIQIDIRNLAGEGTCAYSFGDQPLTDRSLSEQAARDLARNSSPATALQPTALQPTALQTTALQITRLQITRLQTTATLTIPPQSAAQILLQGQPQHWWRRPWLGSGKPFPFQVNLQDAQKLPLAPPQIPGTLTWSPRPFWQLLLAAIAALGTLGALVWLIWWLFFKPPAQPQILSFAAEDAQYAAVRQDIARVRWQINHPERLTSLTLTGYSPDGKRLSGPLTFDLSQGLPSALKSACTQQKSLLTCTNVRTDARQAGQYLFELSAQPKGQKPALTQTSKLVTIAPYPLPIVQEFAPSALVYQEAGPGNGPSSGPDNSPIPSVPAEGITLSWVVTNPQELDSLKLVGRDSKGAINGQIWIEFPRINGSLTIPEALQNNCRLIEVLICKNIPTNITQVGDYQFELTALPRPTPGSTPDSSEAKGGDTTRSDKAGSDQAGSDQAGSDKAGPKPVATEQIKIQPRSSAIASLRINGQEALPKYRIPIPLGQPAPAVLLSWVVQGGSTTSVELLPSPGSVPLQGQMAIPLNQQYGTMTVTLQVKDGTGQTSTRAIALETFDPNPVDPVALSAAAAAEAARTASEVNAAALRNAAQMNQAAEQARQRDQASNQARETAREARAQADQARQQAQQQSQAPLLPPSPANLPQPGAAQLLTLPPTPAGPSNDRLTPSESKPQLQ